MSGSLASVRALDGTTMRTALAAAFPGEVEAAAVRIVRAPGRVNLIGEHTDYNEGYVLPVAIDLETWLAYVPADDRRVVLALASTGERGAFALDSVDRPAGSWIDGVAGLAAALAADGVVTRGLRGIVASTIPVGSGLSSSAALHVAAGLALAAIGIEPMVLALACQRAENDAGVRSGLMDPFAATHGRRDAALLLDCRSRAHEAVRLPLDRYALVVCDSGVARTLVGSAYNARRAECEAAVSALARRAEGITSLRDVTVDLLHEHADALDATSLARAEHVVRENARVLASVAAIRSGRMEALGALFAESHASLRDRYGVGAPELDALVAIATSVEGVVAARMTGAGFGGCTVNIIERGAVADLRSAVHDRYAAATGRVATVHEVAPADAAGPVG